MADASVVTLAREKAKGLQGHARSCKKVPAECALCVLARSWFDSLSPGLLAQVLEDRPAPKRV